MLQKRIFYHFSKDPDLMNEMKMQQKLLLDFYKQLSNA